MENTLDAEKLFQNIGFEYYHILGAFIVSQFNIFTIF